MAPSSVPSPNNFITSFPLPVPRIAGEPTYETLALARKALKGNAVSVSSARGGGQHGYLGLVISAAAYANVSPTPFVVPNNPGIQPVIPAGATGAAIAVIVRDHDEAQREWRECNNLQAALKKQLIDAIDPLYLCSIQDEHVGFGNKTLLEMLDFLFAEYGQISPLELQENNPRMMQAWNPSAPFEALINQIQDACDFAEAAGRPFTPTQIVNNAYALVYNTGMYFDDCKFWNRRPAIKHTWENFKKHFAMAHRELRMQQRTTQQGGYHGAHNAHTIQYTTEALANLATATAADRQSVAALTTAVEHLTNQVKQKDNIIANLLATQQQPSHNNNNNNRPRPLRNNGNYCWTHGFLVGKEHTSANCNTPKTGHQTEATRTNMMGGSNAGMNHINN